MKPSTIRNTFAAILRTHRLKAPFGESAKELRLSDVIVVGDHLREVGTMRIAVASEGLDVSSHFSCCTNFNYYKVENGTLADSRNLPSQGHLCGSQANFLRQIDVKVLLCGSISERDIESMNAAGITVVPGVSGRAIDAAFAYLEDHAAEYKDAAELQTFL